MIEENIYCIYFPFYSLTNFFDLIMFSLSSYIYIYDQIVVDLVQMIFFCVFFCIFAFHNYYREQIYIDVKISQRLSTLLCKRYEWNVLLDFIIIKYIWIYIQILLQAVVREKKNDRIELVALLDTFYWCLFNWHSSSSFHTLFFMI